MKSRTLSIVVGGFTIFALLSVPVIYFGPIATNARRSAVIERPFATALHVEADGSVIAARATYSAHRHLITDLGPVRIAIVNRTDSGQSGGSVQIDFEGDHRGAFGSTGVGPREFTSRGGVNEYLLTFSGIRFAVRDGQLVIDGRSVEIDPDHPKVIFVLPDGTVREVVDASSANDGKQE